MKALRVAFIDHCARLSGAELALVRMLGAMEEIDCHVYLAEDGPLVSKLRESGAIVEVLSMGEGTRNLNRKRVGRWTSAAPRAVISLAYAVRLARKIRALRPDIVHTNTLKAALYGGVAAKLARVPLVVQPNDRLVEDYMPSSAIRLTRTALRWMPDAIVANSQTTLRTLGRPAHWRHPRFETVIYPPVPSVETFECRNGSALRIGMVGRIAPWKGQHVFLEALAKAFGEKDDGSSGEKVEWEAIVVGCALFGEDEQRYEADLRTIAGDLGIEGRVTFLGFRDDVPRELSQMDILVHASINPEPFGLVVVEAMAAGLAVVAAAPGGPAEVVEDGVTGLLYPTADVRALADALRTLAGDEPLRSRIGMAAKAKSAEFTPARTAASMIAVYGSVVSGQRRSGRQ